MNLAFAGASDVIEDPNDSNRFYLAGTKDVGGQYQPMVWVSNDAGENWAAIMPVGSPMTYGSIMYLRIAASNPAIWYLGGYQYDGSAYVPMLYRTDDAGITWAEVVTDLPTYGYELWVSPSDPDYLVMAGYNMGFYSTNGGVNWTEIPDLATQYVRGGAMISHPTTGALYVATYYNGVYTSDDMGLTWTEMNDGLTTSSVQNLNMDLRDGYMYAATFGAGINRCEIPAAPLWAQYSEISQTVPTTVDFHLDAGVANAGRTYLIVGSATGTDPGHALPGGMVLPVNWDWFTDLQMGLINTPWFANFFSQLDGDGMGDAKIETRALPAAAVGLTLNFAYCLNAPFDYVSNPVQINIVN